MADSLKLEIFEADFLAFDVDLFTPLEVGRQQGSEPEPYTLLPETSESPRRLVIAPKSEHNCSRRHIFLQPLPSGLVRVTNRSQVPLSHTGTPDRSLPSGGEIELKPEFQLFLENRTLSVVRCDSLDEFGLRKLDEATLGPAGLGELSKRWKPLPPLAAPQLNELIGWLQTTMSVLQSTLAAADFLLKAAQALVEIVGLHTGRVLILEGDRWTVAADHGVPAEDDSWEPSKHVLDRVRQEKRTFWQQPSTAATLDAASLKGLHSVVAAPILNGDGSVTGILYGERYQTGPEGGRPSGKVEAMLVELLACGVASGLVRQEQERSLLRATIQFEQFFGPELAEQLRREPNLLDGREAEITLVFCDVRGFSGFSEQLGPAGTVRWIGDVLGELSQCALNEGGVLIDYVGDEMLAMWGAPRAQEDHPVRAVRASLAMLATLGELNRRWLQTLGKAMDLGIGVNTGPAQVGNTGSRFKFKYGPVGNTVNLASRVQGLTRYLRCRLLVTAPTRQRLGAEFIARRVVKARVVNIVEPVDLFEVEPAGSRERAAFFQASEEALDALEAGEFARAARLAGQLLTEHPGDGPLLLILTRAAHLLMNPGSWSPVWEPPGK